MHTYAMVHRQIKGQCEGVSFSLPHGSLGISLSGLAAGSFTCRAILSAFNSIFLVTAQPLNVRMNLSQLYGSSTAGYIVCRGVYKIASTRFLICRDLLILQQLLTRLGDAVST